MPTGPEHYRIAEQILDDRADLVYVYGDHAAVAAMAQAHATLALAAATALNDTDGGMRIIDYRAWVAVAGSDAELKQADADG